MPQGLGSCFCLIVHGVSEERKRLVRLSRSEVFDFSVCYRGCWAANLEGVETLISELTGPGDQKLMSGLLRSFSKVRITAEPVTTHWT